LRAQLAPGFTVLLALLILIVTLGLPSSSLDGVAVTLLLPIARGTQPSHTRHKPQSMAGLWINLCAPTIPRSAWSRGASAMV